MAGGKFFTPTTFLLLLAFAFSSAAFEDYPPSKPIVKKPDVGVEGMVYCQSCKHFGTWSLTDAKPIQGAEVSVICKDYKDRVTYYKACKTDKNGYFYAQLDGFKMSHLLLDHPLHSCHMKLVSSPDQGCNLLTDINNALYGAPLRFENKRLVGENYEAVVYAAGPLAFRPSHCPAVPLV